MTPLRRSARAEVLLTALTLQVNAYLQNPNPGGGGAAAGGLGGYVNNGQTHGGKKVTIMGALGD